MLPTTGIWIPVLLTSPVTLPLSMAQAIKSPTVMTEKEMVITGGA
jgi:hypothetical protein